MTELDDLIAAAVSWGESIALKRDNGQRVAYSVKLAIERQEALLVAAEKYTKSKLNDAARARQRPPAPGYPGATE